MRPLAAAVALLVAGIHLAPVPEVATVSPGCHQYDQTALDVGWPRRLLPWLNRIEWRESNCLHGPEVDNGEAAGLMQIEWRVWGRWATDRSPTSVNRWSLRNPIVALRTAWIIYQRSGCHPWTTAANPC